MGAIGPSIILVVIIVQGTALNNCSLSVCFSCFAHILFKENRDTDANAQSEEQGQDQDDQKRKIHLHFSSVSELKLNKHLGTKLSLIIGNAMIEIILWVRCITIWKESARVISNQWNTVSRTTEKVDESRLSWAI